jgi:3-phenylpropionate/cinnamic acid dioxygenase small subunit
MYRYAECVDTADFDGIGELFAHGEITNAGVPGAIVGARAVADLYRTTNRVHADGTLMTRHLTTNVLVDIDEAADTATARSTFVVFQATADVPLQPIVTGRYRDRFARTDGTWHFAQREMTITHVGDVSAHLLIDLDRFR